jgi:hypothetical protein
MPTLRAIWKRIDEETTPSRGYKSDLEYLQSIAPGYAYCFAFRFVDADICNGGFSQLYGNSTWPLTLVAQQAAAQAGAMGVARVLKEAIFYFHRTGRSRFKRQVPDGFFDGIGKTWNKSLSDLEDEYYALSSERDELEQRIVQRNPKLFDSPSKTSPERTRGR